MSLEDSSREVGNDPPQVLDPRQLVRIEAVHRGFLYQHLYLANCLLRAASAGVEKILVEAGGGVGDKSFHYSGLSGPAYGLSKRATIRAAAMRSAAWAPV